MTNMNSKQSLGQMSDAEAAELLGVSKAAVDAARAKLTVDTTRTDIDDAYVARAFGISEADVAAARERARVDWCNEQHFERMSDHELAGRMAEARRVLPIPDPTLPVTEHYDVQQGADVIRAVNGWCFERGMYVVAIGRVAHHDRYHVRVQPAHGADVLCVESDTVSGVLEGLNAWHTTGKPHG